MVEITCKLELPDYTQKEQLILNYTGTAYNEFGYNERWLLWADNLLSSQ